MLKAHGKQGLDSCNPLNALHRSRYVEKALREVDAGDVAAAVTILNEWGAKARVAPHPEDAHGPTGAGEL